MIAGPLVILAALCGLLIGYLLGCIWSRERESRAYEEGQVRGFCEGYERRMHADAGVLHQTRGEEMTA